MFELGEVSKVNGSKKEITFCFVMDPARLDASSGNVEMVRAHGTVSNTAGLIAFTGTVSFSYTDGCARCLEPVTVDFTLPVEETFRREGAIDGKKDDYTFTGTQISLETAVEDNILLNLPQKLICTEDCQGLCQMCGTNLNREQCQC